VPAVPVAAKAALAVLRTRRGRRLLLALLGGLLLGFATVVVTLVGAVNAVVGECRAEASAPTTSSPTTGTPSPTYVSQEPSGEALADIPADYLALYRKAGEDYGLDWAVLAAIGKIETDHGRLDAPGVTSGENFAGAGGPMQFLASTWETVGVDGNGDGTKDRYDPEDAIPGAANYLKLEGAPGDYRSAIFAYNHAQWYVDDVLAKAGGYREAAEEEGDEVASSSAAALATLLSPLGTRPAYAAEGGIVGSPGETAYSVLEIETLRLINAYREENGLAPLLLSDLVSTSAARYAHDMAKYDAYGVPEAHVTGPSDWYEEGADLQVRMNADGYEASGYGENIAVGQETAEEVFEAWRTSPPHNEMMLDPEMRVVGIGLVENPETSYEEFWVTDFGTDEDATARPIPEAGAGSSEGGSAAEGEGDAGAVFPLPEGYFDSYTNDWGTDRPNGGHEGTDLMAPHGVPIFSITDGTVVGTSGTGGNGWNELGGYTTMVEAGESVGPIRAGDRLYYAHQNEPSSVRPGDRVKAGQRIGLVGDTGYGPEGTRGEFPPHLHLGWYDPGGPRAEAASGAMNPYPLLEWLVENGGTASGGEASPAAPGTVAAALPEYCDPFVEASLVSRPSGVPAGAPVDSPGDGSDGATPTRPGTGSAEDLLSDPNFEASPEAEGDLRAGIVDEGLISALGAVTDRHRVRVSVFKTGHPYGEMPDLPAALGGGYNSHYYGRAVDIPEVDGKPVAGNGTDPDVLDVGRILHSLPASARPDEVIGPTDWTAELGYTRDEGFVTDPGFTREHRDHLHVGRGAP